MLDTVNEVSHCANSGVMVTQTVWQSSVCRTPEENINIEKACIGTC